LSSLRSAQDTAALFSRVRRLQSSNQTATPRRKSVDAVINEGSQQNLKPRSNNIVFHASRNHGYGF
jgi:hypothetical protein